MNDLHLRLAESVHRGVAWLESKTSEDGSFRGCENELAAYYKSLLTFAVCGRIDIGAKSLLYLRTHLLGADGELSSGRSKTSITRMERNLANYIDGWVAIGAWILWDHELAEIVCRNLEKQQSPEHGGVLTGPEKWSGPARYDLSTAASCGRALLVAGHRTAAIAAASFIKEALTHQSDPSRWLDLSFDDKWNPLEAPDTSDQTYYRFDLSRRGEKVWFPSFCSAFLCEVYLVTGESIYLDAAESYYNFVARSPEFLDGTIANGKAGWAAGLLARSTRKAEYAAALSRIVPNVLGRQRDDGEFTELPAARAQMPGSPAISAAVPPRPVETPAQLGRRLERTAEFTGWTAEYLRMSASGLLRAEEGRTDG
ncbi:MAG: hypothetical protein PHP88_01240 [bacterium]|nr:hypothetical protein [bacterium]